MNNITNNPVNNDTTQFPVQQASAQEQIQSGPILPLPSFPLLNQNLIPSRVTQWIQEGYKRLRTSEDENATEEGHPSKKNKVEDSQEEKKVDDLVANFHIHTLQLLDSKGLTRVVNPHIPDKLRALLVANQTRPFEIGIRDSNWDPVIELMLALPSTVNRFNNHLIDSGKIIEFIDHIKMNSISDDVKISIVNGILMDREFWQEELTENKRSYFLKIFEVAEAFQNNYLSSALQVFLMERSYDEISWIVTNINTSVDLREGLRYNSHDLLLRVVSYYETLVTTQQAHALTILKYYPKVNLVDSAHALFELKSCDDISADEEQEVKSYEECMYGVLAEHARSQEDHAFFKKFGLKAFDIFPCMDQTVMAIKILSGFHLKDLQNKVKKEKVTKNLLAFSPQLLRRAEEAGVDTDKLLDKLHFINMPCEEPEESLEFYCRLYAFESKRLKKSPKGWAVRANSISAAIMRKEAQIKMTTAFESVFYALDAHATPFYLPEELKQKIALEVFLSERPLSSVPEDMLLEKRMQWIQSRENKHIK